MACILVLYLHRGIPYILLQHKISLMNDQFLKNGVLLKALPHILKHDFSATNIS